MKKFVSVCTALLVFFASAPLAQAAANPYIGISAGIGFLTDSDVEVAQVVKLEDVIEYKSGFGVNGALGLDGEMWRLEGAIGYQVNDLDAVADVDFGELEDFIGDIDAEVAILSFMANGYLDIDMPSAPVSPYLMAGAGAANVSFDIEGESEDDTVFAYQFGAGLGVEVTPNVVLDVGYRYFASSDVSPGDDNDDDVEISIASHNIMAGVRVGF